MEFETRLERMEPDVEADTEDADGVGLMLPPEIGEAFGRRKRISVRGTLNGSPFRTSIFRGEDTSYRMMVNESMRADAGVKAGEAVHVTLEPDPESSSVSVPPDLRNALRRSPQSGRVFEELPFMRRKEFVEWIEDADSAETRRGRIERTVSMLPRNERPSRPSG